jgi:hypothetical protein
LGGTRNIQVDDDGDDGGAGADGSGILMDLYDDADEEDDDYSYGVKNLRYYGFSGAIGPGGVAAAAAAEEERNSEEEDGADMFADEEPDVDGDDAMM